jgi:hypothetical protein
MVTKDKVSSNPCSLGRSGIFCFFLQKITWIYNQNGLDQGWNPFTCIIQFLLFPPFTKFGKYCGAISWFDFIVSNSGPSKGFSEPLYRTLWHNLADEHFAPQVILLPGTLSSYLSALGFLELLIFSSLKYPVWKTGFFS